MKIHLRLDKWAVRAVCASMLVALMAGFNASDVLSAETFSGDIQLDIRDSTPDWAPFTPRTAKKGAPNILFVLYDDTGMGSWSVYGGGIEMPTLEEVASNGLIYSQWNTTALCSPTRSTLLTGRNHHLNGMATITEGSAGFPGQSGYIPASSAPLAKILQDNGYSTFWLGKKSQRRCPGSRLWCEPEILAAGYGI